MLDLVKETLLEKRPSRDGRFAETVALYNEALESLVNKLKQDRYVLAAILYGSLSHDQVWEKSDIDLMIVGREEKKAGKEFCLVENGVNIHATLVPRGKLKAMMERDLQGGMIHSSFSKSTLLFSHDETIRSCKVLSRKELEDVESLPEPERRNEKRIGGEAERPVPSGMERFRQRGDVGREHVGRDRQRGRVPGHRLGERRRGRYRLVCGGVQSAHQGCDRRFRVWSLGHRLGKHHRVLGERVDGRRCRTPVAV